MHLAMANVLHANFVIPEELICHGTIFLVYQGSGSGHYDAALFLKDSAIDSSHSAVTVKEIKCSCG